MVAKLLVFATVFRFPLVVYHHSNTSFLKLVIPKFHAFYLHFAHVQVKQRHTFDTFLSVRVLSIESTLCNFFSRLCNGQKRFSNGDTLF